MWRYRELLPIDGEPTVGTQVGFTPLVRADRLARRLGLRELYIKNDTVNYPTLSFKDRVVSVALSRARELGFEIVACASTGNLANSVAANAAAAGLKSYVLIPADLESGKVLGSLVYGTQRHRHPRRLRSGQPAVLGDRGQVRLGVREREPAALLRRRLEDDGLRDRRAARLARPAPHRRADGQRLAADQDPQVVQGTGDASA